eukprot:1176345-Prorocentrum_minimum.AAC.1
MPCSKLFREDHEVGACLLGFTVCLGSVPMGEHTYSRGSAPRGCSGADEAITLAALKTVDTILDAEFTSLIPL